MAEYSSQGQRRTGGRGGSRDRLPEADAPGVSGLRTYSAAEAALQVDPKILICNMERQGSSTQYVDDTIARNCRFIQLLRGTASAQDMKRLKDAGVTINYCGTNDPPELRELYAAGVEFPLVDDLAAMIAAAKDLGIAPRE